MGRVSILITVLLMMSACATHQHYFAPLGVENSNAFYSAPGVGGKGSVRLRSQGVVDLRPKGRDERIPALHIRMTLANVDSDQTWTLDAREQAALYPNRGKTSPTYVNSDATTIPVVEVKPNESRTVDLYFALPGGEKHDEISEFDVSWKVQAGKQERSETTTFARVDRPADYRDGYSYEGYGIGAGSMWWHHHHSHHWRPRIYFTQPIRIRR